MLLDSFIPRGIPNIKYVLFCFIAVFTYVFHVFLNVYLNVFDYLYLQIL